MRRALAFLTPFGESTAPAPATLAWFPLVGALIGLGVGAAWWLARAAWPAPAAAAVALAADAILTGGLHLDGLADAADGLLPPLERRRRLEVMADPAIGAFGMVTMVVMLLLRFGALASTRPAPLVVAALWCGSRTAMALVTRLVPYARPGGLASAFTDRVVQPITDPPSETGARSVDTSVDTASLATDALAPFPDTHPVTPSGDPGATSPRPRDVPHPQASRRARGTLLVGLSGTVLAVGLAVAGRPIHGLVALGAMAVSMCAVVLLARRRIGGFTGDVLGAAGVTGETVGLLALALTW